MDQIAQGLSLNNYLWHTGLGILGMVGGGGGGGEGYIHIFCQEWIFNKLFTVWKHISLLQLGGWFLMNRKVY